MHEPRLFDAARDVRAHEVDSDKNRLLLPSKYNTHTHPVYSNNSPRIRAPFFQSDGERTAPSVEGTDFPVHRQAIYALDIPRDRLTYREECLPTRTD